MALSAVTNFTDSCNITGNHSGSGGNDTSCDAKTGRGANMSQMDMMMTTSVVMYSVICVFGLLGNGLVVFVITRYTKMKTVTNMYILNLSIADFLFLVGLPFLITMVVLKHWIFGSVMCKVYYATTCINMFTGPFTLTVMSGDRFLAVCYPITSMRYRTPKYAIIVICLIWLLSFLFMLPVLMYTVQKPKGNLFSCTHEWPGEERRTGQKIFFVYTVMLGFVVPVLLICIFYTLLLVRLRTTGPTLKSAEKRRSHRKVTKLVTLIVVVFIVCWLPFWAFQADIMIKDSNLQLANWKIRMFAVFNLLAYANSMVNPLIYAFTNENFRESFISAFKCARDPILGGARRGSDYASNYPNCVSDPTLAPLNNQPDKVAAAAAPSTHYEFTTLNSSSNSPQGSCDSKTIQNNADNP